MLKKRLIVMGLSLAALFLLLGWLSALAAEESAGSGPGGQTAAEAVTQIAPDELEPSKRIGNMRVSTRTGQPLVIYHLNYAVNPGTPEEMAREYLRENATLLHLQAPDLSDLEHTFTRQGPSGPTVRFRQVANGIPVYKSDVVVHLNNQHTVTYVASDYKSTLTVPATAATLTAVDATQITRDYLDIQGKPRQEKSELMLYYLQGQTTLVYRVNIVANSPLGDWLAMVDANSGEFLKLVDQSLDYGPDAETGDGDISPTLLVTGTGNVFDPDPLSSAGATYGDTGFTDNNDADSPQLNGELVSVNLLDISFDGSLYHLDGPYAAIRDTEAPFNGLFSQATSTWNFNRFDNAFEAAHTYYHIDKSMRYLNETLGVSVMPYQYSGGARFDPHGLNGDDNSHYNSGSGEVAFGEGGVDDAEDADVVYHELGHGLHDWITNGGLSQVNGLSEGTGDYWAQSHSRALGQWAPSDPEYQWVFNWDGHNPFWGGRITNYPAVYPGGLVGQVHTDGQIWSTCNMRVWDEIGREQMDRAMWEGLGMTNSSTNQEDAANAVYQAAIDMGYSAAELQEMHDIYLTCVYVVPDVPSADFDVEVTPDTLNVCTPDDAVYTVNVTEFDDFGTAVSLSAVGHPNPPDSAVFSINNQAPPYSSTLTIGTSGAVTGTYEIDVVGMSPTTTHTATVQLLVTDNAPGAPTLVSPADGAGGIGTSPVLGWTAVPGAVNYLVEIADDAGFTNIVYTAAETSTTHTVAISLNTDTTYYWRVTASNACSDGNASTPFSFTTGDLVCVTYDSLDVPVPIPDSGSVTSNLTVPDAGTIVDVNVLNIVGTHTYISDLDFYLESPLNTVVQLQDNICGIEDNFDINYDDEAAPGDPPCPPTDSGTYQPFQALSAFDNENPAGEWTFRIEDEFAEDSGQLTSWSVEICRIPQAPAISLVKTVGTDPNTCASTSSITITTTTTVYYCYEVTNTGNITLTLHDLSDSELGPLFSGLTYDLAPGASVDTVAAGETISATIATTTTNSATWTAYNAGPIEVVTAVASATVNFSPPPPPDDEFFIYLPVIFKPDGD